MVTEAYNQTFRRFTTSRSGSWSYNRLTGAIGTPPSYVQSSSTYINKRNRSYPDTRFSSYQKAIKAGYDATTAFDADRSWYTFQPGYALNIRDTKTTANSGSYSIAETYGYFGPIPNVTDAQFGSIDENAADNIAKTTFISKALAVQQSMAGGAFLGELKEAIEMIHHPAAALRASLDRYHRIVRKNVRGFKRYRSFRTKKSERDALNVVVANTWLEAVFGWRPLLGDIDDGMKALARLNTYRPTRKLVTAFGEDFPSPSSTVSSSVINNWTYRVETLTTSRVLVKYYGMVLCDTSDLSSPASRFREEFGLRWDQLVPTIWELIPYSFLVDYFTNLGNIIQAASFRNSLVWWVDKVLVREMNQNIRIQPDKFSFPSPPVYQVAYDFQSPAAVMARRSVIRRGYLGSLVPSFGFRVPGISSTKWLNIAALGRLRSL